MLAKRSIKLDSCPLQVDELPLPDVELLDEGPPELDKVQVKGPLQQIKPEELSSYLEELADVEVREIIYANAPDMAVAIFDGQIGEYLTG